MRFGKLSDAVIRHSPLAAGLPLIGLCI